MVAAFGAVLATAFAVLFKTVAFAAVFADLLGISPLFLEDLAGDAALWRVSLEEARVRDLCTLRPEAAAAFFEAFEVLFLRVFCDTACAWNRHAPV